MALDDSSPLERASQAMREQPPSDAWVDLAVSIREAVRRTTRRTVHVTAEPEDVDGNPLSSSIVVADRVLRLLLRDEINTPARALTDAAILVEDGAVQALRVEIACVYDVDMVREAEQVRGAARRLLTRVIGPREVPIDVHVVDLLDDVSQITGSGA